MKTRIEARFHSADGTASHPSEPTPEQLSAPRADEPVCQFYGGEPPEIPSDVSHPPDLADYADALARSLP